MKVYLPAIIGYVPDDIVKCLGAFLDAAYIARRQDIDTKALDDFEVALERFKTLREVFRIPGVRPTGFSLPRQHSLSHYRRQIEDFGAPGGLCSSITESRHITAVKKPWRRSNRFEALGQILRIIQRLDKLAAMHSDFVQRGMLSGGRASTGRMLHLLNISGRAADGEDDDGGPVEGPDVLGHVTLAQTRGRLSSTSLESSANSEKHAITLGISTHLATA